ncbi:MAG: ATP-dependent ligase [Bryobacterales bacterium]|nr:ATP-dependent ligase [Bryobacterales bacterium]
MKPSRNLGWGVVGKRLGSLYEPGERKGAWIKHRTNREQEFVIGGYIPGEDMTNVIEQWRQSSDGLPAAEGLTRWFDEVAAAFALDSQQAEDRLGESARTWDSMILVAIRLATSERSTPVQLVKAHCLLLCELPRLPMFRHVETRFVHSIERTWRRVMAQGRISGDSQALQAASNSGGQSVAKAAAVILGALEALALPADAKLLTKLRELAAVR